MKNTELKTFSCKCTEYTCAIIGTKHPLGCCRVHTKRGRFWVEDLEFDDSLFNLDCVPEEAKYISRSAGGIICVWTTIPTLYEDSGVYNAGSSHYLEKASNVLNALFKYVSKDCPTRSLIQRPNLYPEYQKGVFIKAKTSDSVYKIKSRQGNYLTVDRVYPTYCADIGSITLEEANSCYYIVEKDELLSEELRDLVGKAVTHNGKDFFMVSCYRHLNKSGVWLDAGDHRDFMTEYDLLRMEYRTREGVPCYSFKIKEKM